MAERVRMVPARVLATRRLTVCHTAGRVRSVAAQTVQARLTAETEARVVSAIPLGGQCACARNTTTAQRASHPSVAPTRL